MELNEQQEQEVKQKLFEDLQKQIDIAIKELVVDELVKLIETDTVKEINFCPFIEEDDMKKAQAQFNELKALLDSQNYDDLTEQEKDKYEEIAKQKELYGNILNLNHLVIVSNEEKLSDDNKIKYLPLHINLMYIHTDRVDGTYVMNRGQVIFAMIEEPTIENPNKFKAQVGITSAGKLPKE